MTVGPQALGKAQAGFLVAVHEVDRSPPLLGGRQVLQQLAAVGVRREGIDGILFDAIENPQFRAMLLEATLAGETLLGRAGSLTCTAGMAAIDIPAGAPIESTVSTNSRGETYIDFGRGFVIKLFRQVEPGVSPDGGDPVPPGRLQSNPGPDLPVWPLGKGLGQGSERSRSHPEPCRLPQERISVVFHKNVSIPSPHPLEHGTHPIAGPLIGRRT